MSSIFITVSCRLTFKVEQQLNSFEFAIHGATNTSGRELGVTRKHFPFCYLLKQHKLMCVFFSPGLVNKNKKCLLCT